MKKKKAQCNTFRSLLIAFQHTHSHIIQQSASCLPKRIEKGLVDTAVMVRGCRDGEVDDDDKEEVTQGVLHYRGRATEFPATWAEDLPGDGRLTLISKPLREWDGGEEDKTTTVAVA